MAHRISYVSLYQAEQRLAAQQAKKRLAPQGAGSNGTDTDLIDLPERFQRITQTENRGLPVVEKKPATVKKALTARARRLLQDPEYQAAARRGEKTPECEPGEVLAIYLDKAKPDTVHFVDGWLRKQGVHKLFGRAAAVTLSHVLTCKDEKKAGAKRYIGRTKLAKKSQIKVSTLRDHIRKLTEPWQGANGQWHAPLFKRSLPVGRSRTVYWLCLEAGWQELVRELDLPK